jgi:hypothetical protein
LYDKPTTNTPPRQCKRNRPLGVLSKGLDERELLKRAPFFIRLLKGNSTELDGPSRTKVTIFELSRCQAHNRAIKGRSVRVTFPCGLKESTAGGKAPRQLRFFHRQEEGQRAGEEGRANKPARTDFSDSFLKTAGKKLSLEAAWADLEWAWTEIPESSRIRRTGETAARGREKALLLVCTHWRMKRRLFRDEDAR